MSGRFFLDTNIFVYSFDLSSGTKARTAARLIRDGVSGGKGVVSYQVVQEFFSVATRRFKQPMTMSEAAEYLNSVFRPLLTVHSSDALLAEAIRLCGGDRLSWYDSLIVAAALEAKCSVLYSEDMQSGRRFEGMQIQNPFL